MWYTFKLWHVLKERFADSETAEVASCSHQICNQMTTNSPPSVILTDALASLNKAVNIAVSSSSSSMQFIDLRSSRAYRTKHVKKSHKQVLKHGRRAVNEMKQSKLSMSLGLRSRRGSKKLAHDNLLYVLLDLCVFTICNLPPDTGRASRVDCTPITLIL